MGAWRTSIELEQLLELGLIEEHDDCIRIPYQNFGSIQTDIPVSLISAWTAHSPFLLKIDRKSDIGRPDFQYRYSFLLGGKPVHVDRVGYYVRRAANPETFLLDFQMFSLLDAMDTFNALAPANKTPQTSWLTFAKVKGCAKEVGAALDATLQNNDVIVPSTLGLDMREDATGALTFLPKCAELAERDFHQVFERNAGAEKLYSLDRPGLRRVRIVLTDDQHEVLRRMKRIRRVTGPLKERLKKDPVQAFDGIADHIELPEDEPKSFSTPSLNDNEALASDASPLAPPPALAALRSATPDPPPEPPLPKPSEQVEEAEPLQENLPYGDRVIGIGAFKFSPTPKSSANKDSTMATLWHGEPGQGPPTLGMPGKNPSLNPSDEIGKEGLRAEIGEEHDRFLVENEAPEFQFENVTTTSTAANKKYLLIETNEDAIRRELVSEAQLASRFSTEVAFTPPRALRLDRGLRPHQERGVHWLQNCSQIQGRTGVLLADDMGVGKTIQILTFLASCIESGRFPELSRAEPPFRPILIVAPLILVDTRTWESEMENFFANDGAIFWPVLSLHGEHLKKLRRDDALGPELELAKPVLDLNRIQRHRVVITNYETVKNYQYSFAYLKDGKPLWSFIVSDEAQEFKVPSTRISHAMKALKAHMHIACTGTPVENRMLDLWNICDAVQPGLLSTAKEFVKKFETSSSGGNHENSLLQLKKKLLFQQPHSFLLRRTKSDVADLPPKSIVRLHCDMSEKEIVAHRSLLRDLASNTCKARHLSALHGFVEMYQHPAMMNEGADDLSVADLVSQSSKLRVLIAKLHEIRPNGEKVIIFARLQTMQRILAKVLQQEFDLPIRIINGETKLRASGTLNSRGVRTRNAILQDFRERPGFNAIVLSPFVAGIGLTIVEANHVVHYGRWWNPAVESQATDRAYRIGQTRPVTVYLPILRDPTGLVRPSFDERLDVLMEKKQRLAEDFLRPLPDEGEMSDELFTGLNAEASRQG